MRLAGSVCNLFVVVVYVSRITQGKKEITIRARHDKTDPDPGTGVHTVSTVNKSDCIIMMGDLNCELQGNVQGCTGK